MIVEVKARVARIIDNKIRKRTEFYLIEDCDFFVNAEERVIRYLEQEIELNLVDSYTIQQLKIAPVNEIYEYNQEEH